MTSNSAAREATARLQALGQQGDMAAVAGARVAAGLSAVAWFQIRLLYFGLSPLKVVVSCPNPYRDN